MTERSCREQNVVCGDMMGTDVFALVCVGGENMFFLENNFRGLLRIL